MAKPFLIGLLGLAGIYGRYFLTAYAQKINLALPVMTVAINVIGSFLIGVVYEVGVKTALLQDMRVAIMVGLLGGFTTFSAFSLETVTLFASGRYLFGSAYLFGSLAGGIVGCVAGIVVTRASL